MISVFEKFGHEWSVVPDGSSAREPSFYADLDIVIIDVLKAATSGAQTASHMKSRLETKHIPIILAIENGEEWDNLPDELTSQADEYLAKPFKEIELVTRVGSMLRLKELKEQITISHTFIEDELQTAQIVQTAMLPSVFPYPDKVQFYTYYETTSTIGGDYYDVFDYGNGKMGVTIVDVSGHGASAALIVSIIKTLMQSYSEKGLSPIKAMEELNLRLLKLTPEERFATAFFGLVDFNKMTLRYVRCGHPWPYIIREKDKSITELKSPGGLLGMFDDLPFTEETVKLFPGDKVLMFSDGLTEVCDENNKQYGSNGLRHALEIRPGVGGDQLIDEILEETWKFNSGKCGVDDVAILLMEVL